MSDYHVGYFDVDGEIVKVRGESDALDKARHDDSFPTQVFWSEEALLTHREDRRREAEENTLLAEWLEWQRQTQINQARELRKNG